MLSIEIHKNYTKKMKVLIKIMINDNDKSIIISCN